MKLPCLSAGDSLYESSNSHRALHPWLLADRSTSVLPQQLPVHSELRPGIPQQQLQIRGIVREFNCHWTQGLCYRDPDTGMRTCHGARLVCGFPFVRYRWG